RFSDAAGAAARFAALGATAHALRLRLVAAPDSDARAAIKRELLAFIQAHPAGADARQAVEVIDRAFSTLSAADELAIARSAAIAGPPARAVIGFERALTAGSLTPRDRLAYAQVLARVGRSGDAFTQLDAVEGP